MTAQTPAHHVLADRKRLWAFWLGCLVVTRASSCTCRCT
jgi:putative MFS transporter